MKESHDASNRLSIELDGDDRKFSTFASRLKSYSKTNPSKKLNSPDEAWWDYKINQTTVVLHSDNYMGVSIHTEDGSNEELLRSIAKKITEPVN